MKCIVTSSFLILVLFSYGLSQNVGKDIAKNPKIKSCEEYAYASFGNFDETKHKTFFDKDGNKIKTIVKNADGSIRNVWEFIYNKNLLIEKVVYESDGKTVDSKELYIYENGNMIEMKHYIITIQGDLYQIGSNTFKYDKNGRKIEENEGIMLKHLYKYDNDNLVEKITYFYGTIPDTTVRIYYYNESGKLSKEISISPTGETNLYSTFKYDENDRLILEEFYNTNDKMTSKFVMNYDKYGNITEKIEYYFSSNKKLTTNYSYEFYDN